MPLRLSQADLKSRGHGQANHAAGLVDSAWGIPAADREDAVWRQTIQKDLPGFDRIQAIFTKRKSARASGGPRVDQAHLDDIERLLRAGKPTPGFIDFE